MALGTAWLPYCFPPATGILTVKHCNFLSAESNAVQDISVAEMSGCRLFFKLQGMDMDMAMGPAGLSANQSQTPAKKPMLSQQAAVRVPVIALAQIAMMRPRGLSSLSGLKGLQLV